MCKLLHRGPTDTRSPTDTVLVRLVFSSLNFFDDFFEGGTKGVREKEGERESVCERALRGPCKCVLGSQAVLWVWGCVRAEARVGEVGRTRLTHIIITD